jgi:hypothetical protein
VSEHWVLPPGEDEDEPEGLEEMLEEETPFNFTSTWRAVCDKETLPGVSVWLLH